MALKVKAKEQYQNIGKHAGKYRYVMMPELYTALTQDKVIKEAALRSGVSRGVMQACWDAAGEVIKAWATEGHSVALPGLGTMRFGLRAKRTAVQITCYDRTGKEVKRVTSADDGTVEDNKQTPGSDTGSNTSNTGSDTGGDTQGGDNTGGGSTGDNGDRDPDGGTNSDERA